MGDVDVRIFLCRLTLCRLGSRKFSQRGPTLTCFVCFFCVFFRGFFRCCFFFFFKDIYLSKALSCMKFYCINKKCFFIKATDSFGHIVVWTFYAFHLDHFMPQHTAFEQSTAGLSVFLESLPGLIPFKILWHAGWSLEKNQLHEHKPQWSD